MDRSTRISVADQEYIYFMGSETSALVTSD